jgi:hypothetical protein
MNASWARLDEEALRAPHGSASSLRENRRSSDSFLRKILKSTWVLVNVLVLIAMPLIIWDMYKHDMETHYVAWFVAGVFVLLAVPITFYEVAQHLEHYHMPRLQRYVIRILWMVPIYAVDCWLALRFKEQTIYFDTIRECYEAYVIYNFYNYCTVYLQEFTTTGLESIVSRKPQQQHLGPLRFLLPEMPKMGEPFLRLCRHGIINYVVVRPIISAAEVICDANGVLGDGQILNPLVAFPYLTLVNNASQAWAMYCLILFYRATHEELAPIRPFAKFCTVKAVVFLSFWQGQSIMLLVKWGVIPVPENGNVAKGTKPDAADYDAADVATGMQEFLICVEMFFAAIAHAYAFPTSEYEKRSSHDDDDDDDDSYLGLRGGRERSSSTPRRVSMFENVKDMFDLRDVYLDVINYGERNRENVFEGLKGAAGMFVGGSGGGSGGGGKAHQDGDVELEEKKKKTAAAAAAGEDLGVRVLQGLQSIDGGPKKSGGGGAGHPGTEMNIDTLIPGVSPVVSPTTPVRAPPGGLPPLEREASSKFR